MAEPSELQLDQDLDTWWNRLTAHEPSPPDPEPLRADIATVRFLESHHTAPKPSPSFVRGLKAELLAQAVVLPNGVMPMPNGFRSGQSSDSAKVRWVSWRETRGRLWGLAELAAVAALILVFLGGTFGDGPFGGLNSVWQNPNDPGHEIAMYRGNAARTGVSPDSGPSGVPELKWRKRFHAMQHGETGVAADGRIFLPQNDRGELIAVDAESGDLLWTAQVGLIAQSPPAVGNGLVYIATAGKNIGGGNDGYLIALDAASGVERWRLQTGGSVGSSPAVDGDSVYVFSSNKVLRALDAQSGQERWAVDVGPDWITPEMLETWYPPTASPAVANGIVYAPDFLGSMIALDAEDGHELWRFKSEGEETHTPAVADGVVFFTATRPSAGWVYAVDATTGEEQWRVEDAHLSSIAVTVAEGLVYYAGGTSSPITYALDAATGVTVWRYQSGGFVADLVYAQGRIYASSSDGKVHVIDAQRGAPLWYADTRNWRILEPIISGELLVIPSQDGTVYTIESGQEDATPAARKVFDVSGLPPCDASRSRAMVRLEGTPAATLLPNAPVIGRWPQIRSDEIPQGISASDEAQAGIMTTLKDMAACDQATGWMTARSFFTDDYLRRAQAEDLLASFVYDAEGGPATSFDDARELRDGRVGIIIDRGTQPGELVIFAEVDGVWLIDERYEIVPELGGGG